MEYKLFSSSSRLIFLNLSKNVIKIHCHFSSLYSVLNVFQFVSGQKRHQGFRGKSVLGSLLVISNICHVSVDLVASSENVVNDFAQIPIEVCGGHLLQFLLITKKIIFALEGR